MPRRLRLRVDRSWVLPALMSAAVSIVVAPGAAAAIEADTVSSYWYRLWWSISLITTVGFAADPPSTGAGAVLSVVLMVVGGSCSCRWSALPWRRSSSGRRRAAYGTKTNYLRVSVSQLRRKLARPHHPETHHHRARRGGYRFEVE